MKLLSLLFSVLALAVAADLSKVRSVYILSMGSGLDQYLANRLTEDGGVQVVTDARRADAVLTDHLGPSFEDKMNDLYPPPPKPVEAKDTSKDTSKDTGAAAGPPGLGDTVNKLARPASSFGRGRGTIFLVDVKSRAVLWSIYEKPKDSTSAQLDRAAARIVTELKKKR